jgi:sugar lactone lactonase YvrE
MEITILDERCLSLGEGINKDPSNSHIAWVDINNQQVFYKSKNSDDIKTYKIEHTPSSILKVEENTLLVLDDLGVGQLELNSGEYKRVENYEPLVNDESLRANDAILDGEELFFGIMGFIPQEREGAVYNVSEGKVKKLFDCRIPNTFIKNGNDIYISDSMEQRVYKYDLANKVKSVWKDFSQRHHVPDGACLNEANGFYICMWGAGEVHNYSFAGELIEVIEVPVKNPTKCVLLDNTLVVTSAKEEVTDEDLKIWPKSGQTLLIKLRHSNK